MFNLLKPKVPQIDAEGVKKAIDAKEPFALLDVRTPMEFAKEHIAGSMNIPVDEIQKKVKDALPDKKKTIYVYCVSGSRSIYAVETIVKLGYIHVYNMKSGLMAWRAKKYQIL